MKSLREAKKTCPGLCAEYYSGDQAAVMRVVINSKKLADLIRNFFSYEALKENNIVVNDDSVDTGVFGNYGVLGLPEYHEDAIWFLMMKIYKIHDKALAKDFNELITSVWDELSEDITGSEIFIKLTGKNVPKLSKEVITDIASYYGLQVSQCESLIDMEDLENYTVQDLLDFLFEEELIDLENDDYIEAKFTLESGKWVFSYDGICDKVAWFRGDKLEFTQESISSVDGGKIDFDNYVEIEFNGRSLKVPCSDNSNFADKNNTCIENFKCLKQVDENKYSIVLPEDMDRTMLYNGLNISTVFSGLSNDIEKIFSDCGEYIELNKLKRVIANGTLKKIVFSFPYQTAPVDDIIENYRVFGVNSLINLLIAVDKIYDSNALAEHFVKSAKRKKDGTLFKRNSQTLRVDGQPGINMFFYSSNTGDDEITVQLRSTYDC